MSLQRALAPSEAAMAATGSPTVAGWTLHGDLDTGLLRDAVQVLAHRMPVLSARIAEGSDGLVLRRDTTDEPVGLGFASDGWASHDAHFLRPGDRVLRVLLRRDGPREHTLALLAWHAVSDGACMLALHQRLWRIYRELAAGGVTTPPAESAGLPRPLEEHLLTRHSPADVTAYATHWSARLDASQPAVLFPRAAHDGGPGPVDGAHRHRFTLSAQQTEALTRAAHRHGTSANNLLCAMTVTAVRGLLSPKDGLEQLTCLVPVDLRSRLRPPLSADEFAFAASTASATVTVGPETGLGATAAEIGRQLRTALDAGHAELEYLATAHMLSRLASAAVTAAVSNVAPYCAPPVLPAGLTATRPHVLTIPPGPVPTLFVTRHDEALCLDLVQPRAWYTREQAGHLANALLRTLTVTIGAPGLEDLDLTRPAPPAR
ncbi:phthiocerol/phthiodiolone dimycocerosyl transferase family protein [Streptomyces sp. NPDC004069]